MHVTAVCALATTSTQLNSQNTATDARRLRAFAARDRLSFDHLVFFLLPLSTLHGSELEIDDAVTSALCELEIASDACDQSR